ncbi:MAG: amidohydrolase family protein [Actinomycetota bacterium]|jgi:imidazolonepropionase-like amidohydrolase|nr:amidohydrolase family protein [Actinomycetota bacterium]
MTLVLRDVHVVDLARRRTPSGQSVLIDGGEITRVVDGTSDVAIFGTDGAGAGAAGASAAGAAGAEAVDVIECGGRYLLPGLTDAHVHLRAAPRSGPHSALHSDDQMGAERTAPALEDLVPVLHGYLYCGVTTLFDAGNYGTLAWPLREAERGGRILAPRIHCAGPFVTCTGGHGSELADSVAVDRLPEDEPQLRAHLRHRPDLVKITYDEHNWGIRPLIPILGVDVLRGIVEIAHDEDIPVTVHVSNELRAREAVECGADALAHPVIQSPMTEELAARLAARRVPVVSTLAIGERYVRLADDPGFLDGDSYVRCVAPEERERLKTVEHERQRANRWADWMRVMTPVAQDNLRRLVEAGAVVVSGSDLSLGPDLLRELQLLQDAGIEPWDVLCCATTHAARFLDAGLRMGTVEPGKLADLVLVDGDPTTDVSRLLEISMVMKGGEIIDRSTLQLAGERPGPSVGLHSPLGAQQSVNV